MLYAVVASWAEDLPPFSPFAASDFLSTIQLDVRSLLSGPVSPYVHFPERFGRSRVEMTPNCGIESEAHFRGRDSETGDRCDLGIFKDSSGHR